MIKLNGEIVPVTIFPDQTSQVWKIKNIPESYEAVINWNFESESELIHLAQLKHLLNAMGVMAIDLHLSYLPYGRQDKPISNESTFALFSFCFFLNSLKFRSIQCIDPHSNVPFSYLENFIAHYPNTQVMGAYKCTNSDLVCYPDKGALSKYTQFYKFPHIYGEKVRDQLTGQITSYSLIFDNLSNPKDKSVLIVDDICDGGMTFILLAKDLLAAGAKEVNLFVSHGIFSKGLGVLKDAGIKRIFTKEGEKL